MYFNYLTIKYLQPPEKIGKVGISKIFFSPAWKNSVELPAMSEPSKRTCITLKSAVNKPMTVKQFKHRVVLWEDKHTSVDVESGTAKVSEHVCNATS